MAIERKRISYYTIDRRISWQGKEDVRSSSNVNIFENGQKARQQAEIEFPEPLQAGEYFVAKIITLLLTEEEIEKIGKADSALAEIWRQAQNNGKFLAKVEQNL